MNTEDPNRPGGSTDSTAPAVREQASDELHAVASKAKSEFDTLAHRATRDAKQLGDQAQAKAGEMADKAKSFASDQKDLAANQITGVAEALSKVADELDGSEQRTVARYARDLANGLTGFGKQMQNRDVDDLVGAAQDFGRRQPVAFLGAAALAGFVASRFAMASAHRRDSAQGRNDIAKTQPPTSQASAVPGSNSYAQNGYGQSGGSH